jgi:hypothetical protein
LKPTTHKPQRPERKPSPESPAAKRIRQLADVRNLLADLAGGAIPRSGTAMVERWAGEHVPNLVRIIAELKAKRSGPSSSPERGGAGGKRAVRLTRGGRKRDRAATADTPPPSSP